MRYRVLLAAATIAALSIFTAGPALAVVVPGAIDQQQTDVTWNPAGFGGVTLGQTFTVGQAGTLTAVTVDVNPYAPAITTTATLSIFALDVTGLPTGSALASNQTTAGDGNVAFVFAAPLAVTVGEKLAVTLSWDAGESMIWRGTCAAQAYIAGEALMNEGAGWELFSAYVSGHELSTQTYCLQDFAFATYVLAAADPTSAPTAAPTAAPTSTPVMTLPTTSATQPGTASGSTGGLLLLALTCLALGATAMVVRRVALARR